MKHSQKALVNKYHCKDVRYEKHVYLHCTTWGHDKNLAIFHV